MIVASALAVRSRHGLQPTSLVAPSAFADAQPPVHRHTSRTFLLLSLLSNEMNPVMTSSSAPAPKAWLASAVRQLLEEKYGRTRVPGVRRISLDIREANGGETISHGHINNILNGEAENLTDKTRNLLAVFFGKHPAYFYPPPEETRSDFVQALAARLATFDAAQIAAIEQAIDIVAKRPDGKGH